MAFVTPLWQQNAAYPAQADRGLIGAFWSPGVTAPADLKVSPKAGGATMSVDVAAGTAIIEGTGTPDQGQYVCRSTSKVNLAISAAPTSGQNRIDLVVATVRDSSVSGSNDDWVVQVVTGTPSAIPTAPSVPASSMPLAAVTVPGGAATITAGLITDGRVLSGQRSDAGSTSIRPSFDGQVMGTGDGRLWVAKAGTWKLANEPLPAIGPNPTRVFRHENQSWQWNSRDVAVINTLTVPSVPFETNLTMWWSAWVRSADNAPAYHYYDIASPQFGGGRLAVAEIFTASTLQPVSASMVAHRAVSAGQAVTLTVAHQAASGKTSGANGHLVVMSTPV